MKIKPWHEIDEKDLEECKGPRGGFDEFELARLLERKSCLKYSKAFPKLNLYYLYDREQGIYVEMHPPEMKSFLANIAYNVSKKIARMRLVLSIFNEIYFGPLSEQGEPCFDRGKLSFLNGTLDLRTRQFGPWSPANFIVYKVDYNYDPEATCPNIEKFLSDICEGHGDRSLFLRSWLYTLLYGNYEGQVILYVWGRGGSGKSTLANVITAFIGRGATITTNLRSLHKDPFEVTNLRGKKLISMSDTEYYRGDLSILKMISGGDSISGRMKFVQGAHEVNIEGQVLIVGNYPLGSRDTSGAISRRLRMFPANKTYVENRRFDLINYRGSEGYTGLLVQELPGLMNSVLKLKGEEALRIVSDTRLTPSLEAVQRETEERSNPVLRWVREELMSGDGAYLGYKSSSGAGSKDHFDEISGRKVLYPTFERWTYRNGLNSLSHIMFAQTLLNCLQAEGYSSEKIKREKGVYFTGVTIRPEVYDRDYIYGAPTLGVPDLGISNTTNNVPVIDSSKSINNTQNSIFGSIEDHTPEIKDHKYSYPSKSKNFYFKYLSSLDKTPLKDKLNKFSKCLEVDIQYVANKFFENCKLENEGYRNRIRDLLRRYKGKLSKFGAIPHKYKPMGVSPRILPLDYGTALNCSKKIFREEIYHNLGNYAFSELKARVVDVDLVSCYTSIPIGLYPEDLDPIKQAIEGKGLWKYIEEEFAEHNNLSAYNKSSAKVCVYASVFQGGNKAMIEGILDNFRKDLGLTTPLSKKFSGYEECYQSAHAVVTQMQKSKIVSSFRQVADKVLRTYNGTLLEGPTGHQYPVDPTSFRKSYPQYLQSYEFTILAVATPRVLGSIQGAEVIGHYHDGNVLIVPEDKLKEFKNLLDTEVFQVGNSLGLLYPQTVECKYYPPL